MTPDRTSHADPLWVTLLPSFGSVLLFLAAMITLVVTIRTTNRRAKDDRDAAQERANDDRDAAQQRANADREAALVRARDDRSEVRRRDADVWRRDTLLRTGAEAMEAAYAVEDTFRAIATEPDAQSVSSHVDGIQKQAARIGACFFTLRLIGAHDAADQCRNIRLAAASPNLLAISLESHELCRHIAADPANSEGLAGHAALLDKLDRELRPSVSARSMLGELVEQELSSLIRP